MGEDGMKRLNEYVIEQAVEEKIAEPTLLVGGYDGRDGTDGDIAVCCGFCELAGRRRAGRAPGSHPGSSVGSSASLVGSFATSSLTKSRSELTTGCELVDFAPLFRTR
jgi:hypothetical protein